MERKTAEVMEIIPVVDSPSEDDEDDEELDDEELELDDDDTDAESTGLDSSIDEETNKVVMINLV